MVTGVEERQLCVAGFRLGRGWIPARFLTGSGHRPRGHLQRKGGTAVALTPTSRPLPLSRMFGAVSSNTTQECQHSESQVTGSTSTTSLVTREVGVALLANSEVCVLDSCSLSVPLRCFLHTERESSQPWPKLLLEVHQRPASSLLSGECLPALISLGLLWTGSCSWRPPRGARGRNSSHGAPRECAAG